MFAEGLRTLYGYNRWATERVLAAATGLPAEQLLTPGQAGRGSVRDTLVHLVSAQRGWLAWWDGSLSGNEAYGERLNPADFPDLATLRREWEAVQARTEAFVAGLDEDDLARTYAETTPDGTPFQMPLWQMLLHVANHGTQHRSEVAAMLTPIGHSPGDLDLLDYCWHRGQGTSG